MALILAAGAIAFVVAIFGTRIAIGILVSHGYGQLIRDDGPTSHHTKRGTPTMGGAVIIVAVVMAYTLSHLLFWTPPSVSGLLALFLMTGMGAVGFLDDFIKVSKQRSLGLRAKAKLAGQAVVALAFVLLATQFPDNRGLTPASQAVSFVRDTPLVLPLLLFVVFALLIIAGTSNAVNLTDGLDGLATGATIITASAYVVIGIWQFNQRCEAVPGPQCYEVRNPYDMALFAAALAGACVGFLWWNASPAKIFMGDTGSLALGGALAALAILTRTELLLPLLGGLFVIITASVMIQVGMFKLTRRLTGTGQRVFRMAPLQHHFELKGWAEVTIVIRFWIIAGLCAAAGVGVFYAEWIVS
jgi:phospho-N-acetylmuramoyl-pentapeptide-transferase